MKTKNIFVFGLIAIFLTLMLVACPDGNENDNNNSGTVNKALNGTWKEDERGDIYIFKNGNSEDKD